VPAIGPLTRRALSRPLGWHARIGAHVDLALPEASSALRRRIVAGAADNAGRAIMEMYSGAEFVARVADLPIGGPGAAMMAEARDAGRPIVLVPGHFGNYNAARAALTTAGYRLGALYRPMRNAAFNTHYVEAMEAMGGALFPRGRSGLGGILKHLRGGGMLAIFADLHVGGGAPLTFFGRRAMTTLTPADLAARFDALMVPCYAIRRPDGLTFDIEVATPVPPGSPEERMQAVNDDLERQVRARPEQWFWIHRRWREAD
jgi:KDO2-lipid IV(A) lauroyltransferase